MIAVIKTGGKQYKVSSGDKIKIEKLEIEEGGKVVFDEVLFVGDEKDAEVGAPFIEGKTVTGKVISQSRHKKVWGIKHKSKKRYKMKFGHKQFYTEVEIEKIG